MINTYEKHGHQHYISSDLPFIFHNDIVDNSRSKIAEHTVHWHENPEFLRCFSGKGKVILSADSHKFSSDMLVNISPNLPHSIVSDVSEKLNYNCLIINIDFCRENGFDPEMLYFLPKTDDPEALRLFDRAFLACSDNKNDLHVAETRVYVLDFLLYICRKYRLNTGKKLYIASDDNIKKTIIYIRDNFSEQLSLSKAAQMAGYSVYYYSHEFKRLTGMSFTVFLNTVRCENAHYMLENGSSVTDACFACGFKDISYFSRTFQKLTGETPSSVKMRNKY